MEGKNVSPDGFWELPIDSITVDGTDIGLDGRTAILDTGTVRTQSASPFLN